METRSKRKASPNAGSLSSQAKRPAIVPLLRFSGTINAIKRSGLRAPGTPQGPTVEYVSGLIESAEELEEIAGKINTIGFVGSMSGPGSRRDFGHPLRTASDKGSIDFKTHLLVLAIFDQRVREPTIRSATPASATELHVTCGDRGVDRGSHPVHNGRKMVGFAAIVLPRPGNGRASSTWKQVTFKFGETLPEQRDSEEEAEDDEE